MILKPPVKKSITWILCFIITCITDANQVHGSTGKTSQENFQKAVENDVNLIPYGWLDLRIRID